VAACAKTMLCGCQGLHYAVVFAPAASRAVVARASLRDPDNLRHGSSWRRRSSRSRRLKLSCSLSRMHPPPLRLPPLRSHRMLRVERSSGVPLMHRSSSKALSSLLRAYDGAYIPVAYSTTSRTPQVHQLTSHPISSYPVLSYPILSYLPP